MSGSEDGTIRLWHVNTYRLEFTLNYGFERVWCVAQLPGSNTLSIGYDEGAIMIKLGREQPAITMDNSGKIIWAKHSEIQQVRGLLNEIKTFSLQHSFVVNRQDRKIRKQYFLLE